MRIEEMLEKMALLWPRKFNPEAIPVQMEVYRAAVGHAEGEPLECAWKIYLQKGVQTYPPSPRELRELLPSARVVTMPSAKGGYRQQRDERMERSRRDAESWLMGWWAPLIASAEKSHADLAASLRRAAMVECNARAFPIALAGGTDGAEAADLPRCANAMARTMERCGIRPKRLPLEDLPKTSTEMWRAMHGGPAEAERASA